MLIKDLAHPSDISVDRIDKREHEHLICYLYCVTLQNPAVQILSETLGSLRLTVRLTLSTFSSALAYTCNPPTGLPNIHNNLQGDCTSNSIFAKFITNLTTNLFIHFLSTNISNSNNIFV